ncbi:hypothetical protein [Sporomusa sphaeroides]|nr:hypothetical protein [Sporomusa sphaeroides]
MSVPGQVRAVMKAAPLALNRRFCTTAALASVVFLISDVSQNLK